MPRKFKYNNAKARAHKTNTITLPPGMEAVCHEHAIVTGRQPLRYVGFSLSYCSEDLFKGYVKPEEVARIFCNFDVESCGIGATMGAKGMRGVAIARLLEGVPLANASSCPEGCRRSPNMLWARKAGERSTWSFGWFDRNGEWTAQGERPTGVMVDWLDSL